MLRDPVSNTLGTIKMREQNSVAGERYGMTELIHMVNSLQELGLDLSLPRIAVVGGQSAGKSSVLECIVGKDFLPRGTGMVTRRPLLLQLHHIQGEEYATFHHTGQRTFALGEEVRREILAETERELGKNRWVSPKEIILKIFSPKVLNLTLVDLPGMIRVPMKNQPEDIEVHILNMVSEYIKDEDTIILAVSPANQDLANSDALKWAKDVDPNGNRTIGVITKLDLMDKGTDARDLLNNKVLPLQKGYIGVVNRSQEDINNQKSISGAAEAEREFFQTSAYRDMMDKHGINYLQNVLHNELGKAIIKKLPIIRNELFTRAKETEADLKALGYDEFTVQDNKTIFRRIQKFSEILNGNIDGEGRYLGTDKVNQGAIIHRKFYTEFKNIIRNPFYFLNEFDLDREIQVACANAHGVMAPIALPEKVVKRVLEKLISRYEAPLNSCVALIKTELEGTVEDSLESVSGFPMLSKELRLLTMEQIARGETATVDDLKKHIKAQMAFINLKHPDYGRASDHSREIPTVNENIIQDAPSKKKKKDRLGSFKSFSTWSLNGTENGATQVLWKQPKVKDRSLDEAICGESMIKEEANEVKKIVGNYMEIVDTTIRDMTPKYIMCSLVGALQDYVKDELTSDLMEGRTSPEAQQELLKWEESSRVPELLEIRDAIKHGQEILSKLQA